jgi:hypothetical protein
MSPDTFFLHKLHGIRTLYSRDRHFARFAFLRVVDPLKQEQRLGKGGGTYETEGTRPVATSF